MIQIKTFYFNDLRVCTYVLWDSSKECVIVDPGCHTQREQERLANFIEETDLKPVKLLNTHGHFDHVMGNAFVANKWSLKTYIHPYDKSHLERALMQSELFGYNIEQPPLDTIDVNEGDKIGFGNSTLEVLYTPGHTQGGISFYNREDKIVLTGDALFSGSIGRTDLPGGDYDQLMESLLNKIVKLGDEYRVYPGHGPYTTIGKELATNPFLHYE